MSGGSYNYLCYEDSLEGLCRSRRHIEQMRDRLLGLDYAQDAAAETEDLLALLSQVEVRILVRVKRLHEVWHAIEWWDSADYGEDQVKEALSKYRGEAKAEAVDHLTKALDLMRGSSRPHETE